MEDPDKNPIIVHVGDNTVTEEDLKKRQETAQEADTKPKSRRPGQWPPLPPRGYISGKQSTETMSGDKNDASKELPPPPPRPSYNWSSEYVVPPRLGTLSFICFSRSTKPFQNSLEFP